MKRAEKVVDEAVAWQPTTIKEMTTAMKNLRECMDIKSEDELREQEARIAKLEREAEDGGEKAPVIISFEGDIGQYSK
jgi:sialic acid synthase SpsE